VISSVRVAIPGNRMLPQLVLYSQSRELGSTTFFKKGTTNLTTASLALPIPIVTPHPPCPSFEKVRKKPIRPIETRKVAQSKYIWLPTIYHMTVETPRLQDPAIIELLSNFWGFGMVFLI